MLLLYLFLILFYGANSSVRDDALCDIIAATNIETIGAFSKWSCTNSHVPVTDPCTDQWEYLNCASSEVVYLFLSSSDLTGMYEYLQLEYAYVYIYNSNFSLI